LLGDVRQKKTVEEQVDDAMGSGSDSDGEKPLGNPDAESKGPWYILTDPSVTRKLGKFRCVCTLPPWTHTISVGP
jgi:hypothetical protein